MSRSMLGCSEVLRRGWQGVGKSLSEIHLSEESLETRSVFVFLPFSVIVGEQPQLGPWSAMLPVVRTQRHILIHLPPSYKLFCILCVESVITC